MDEKIHHDKLPNAPLQEIVFELLWEVGRDEHGFPFDDDFGFAQGLYAELTKIEFPFRKKTAFAGVPWSLYPVPMHQFWKAENTWPVLQIGKGILVVNDTKSNYRWENYKKLIHQAIQYLLLAYQKDLTFITVRLKYIYAYEIGEVNNLIFINNNFNICLNNQFMPDENLVNVNLNQTFRLENSNNMDVVLSTGYSPDNKPAIIWQLSVYQERKMIENQLAPWLDNAHEIAGNYFKQFVNKDFYARFTEDK